MAQGSAQGRQGGAQPHILLHPTHRVHPSQDLRKSTSGNEDGLVSVPGRQLLFWFCFVSVYLYLLCFAARGVNNALQNAKSQFDVARAMGGALMFLTVPLAIYQILLHLSNFVEPRQQSQIVRIVFMVPTYSVTAFLSLCFVHWSLFIATVRECYEAYVIYCFLHFLVGTLGDGLPAANSRLAAMPPVVGRHTPPFCCLEPWHMGKEFLQRCQQGVLQYVLIRLLSTGVALGLQLGHHYTEGNFDPTQGYLWITVVTCLSQSWALYVLVLFYRATHKELVHIHPMGKFLAIKTIVFFSWWQGILIEFLEGRGYFIGVLGVSSTENLHPSEHVAQGIQDLLICLEMLVAAVFFFYAFPLSDYLRPQEEGDDPTAVYPLADSDSLEDESLQGSHHNYAAMLPASPTLDDEMKLGMPVLGSAGSASCRNVKGSRADGKPKRKGLAGESLAGTGGGTSGSGGAIGLTHHKSHPRLDLMNRSLAGAAGSTSMRSFRQQRLSVWEALRQSACPMELRVDLRAVCAGLVAQRARISERFAFLTKRKVEARQGGGAGVGAGSSAGRVVTL